jgi:hypothetical protein
LSTAGVIGAFPAAVDEGMNDSGLGRTAIDFTR